MKKWARVIISNVFILLGLIFVILSQKVVIGAVIGLERFHTNILGFIGIVFIGVGVGMMFARRREVKTKDRLKEIIDNRSVLSYNDLKKIVEKLDFELKEGSRHTEVYKGTQRVTSIPRHKRDQSTHTYWTIVKELYAAA
ncbi:MAG: hypothetical protein WC533_01865 [Candidatus Pacearchaeota archaeon]